MDPLLEHEQLLTRRHFFGRTGAGPGHDRPGVAADRELLGRDAAMPTLGSAPGSRVSPTSRRRPSG